MWDFFKTKLGRILGTIMGMSGAGFFGAMAGFAIGAIIDKLHKEGVFIWENDTDEYEPADFILSSMILASAVIKSDGNTDQHEISFIKNFLLEQYGDKKSEEYLAVLERALNQNWDLRKTTQHIRNRNNYETRLQLLYFLFGIANSDFKLNDKEIATIKIISIHLGVTLEDYNTIKIMFISEIDSFYKTLDVFPTASDAEIKKAYRQQAARFHPDKIQDLGPGLSYVAKEKFLKLQQAYNKIKELRGFK